MQGADLPTLRRLARTDFPQLSRWLAQPHVARWWHHETSAEAIDADFGAVADGREPTELFIVEAGARAVGLLQRYRLADYANYLAELRTLLAVPDEAFGIDYLIGEPAALGRGLGAASIAAGVDAIWCERPDAVAVVVAVHALNTASSRALERAGFACVAEGPLTPDNPSDDRAHRVYRIDRPARAATMRR